MYIRDTSMDMSMDISRGIGIDESMGSMDVCMRCAYTYTHIHSCVHGCISGWIHISTDVRMDLSICACPYGHIHGYGRGSYWHPGSSDPLRSQSSCLKVQNAGMAVMLSEKIVHGPWLVPGLVLYKMEGQT